MNSRDASILRHVARHGLTLRPVLQRCCFGRTDSSSVLNRLRTKLGFIVSEQLPGGYSYYRLTDAGAAALTLADQGSPSARHYTAGVQVVGQQLLERVASLFACCWQRPRLLLYADEAEGLLGGRPPQALHCIHPHEDPARAVMLRIYVPSPETEVRRVLEQSRHHVETLSDYPQAEQFAATRNYGWMVLAYSRERARQLRDVFHREGISGNHRFLFEVAPAPETVDSFLKQQGRSDLGANDVSEQ